MTGALVNEPEYSLEEDDNFINITIPAPLSRPDNAAIILEENVVTFDTHPYLLRLKLPCKVLDDYNDVTFDVQTSIYTIKLKKDPTGNSTLDEDVESEPNCIESELLLEGLEKDKPYEESGGENQFYGFGNLYSNMFGQLYDEFADVLDLPNPDKTDPKERTKLRNNDEGKKWDFDHYLADTMEPENCNMNDYLNYNPFWERSSLRDDLLDDEKEVLENLTKKEWMKTGLSDEIKKKCELQMIDVLFAYAYNKRITEGDNTVTSAWNITKLSATLSWFEVFENVKEVLISCFRRCLIYPLCRNWNLAQAVKMDVARILNLGPKVITRCFLEVRDIFNETDNYYVLSTLYVNDLAHFAFNLDKDRTVELSKEVKETEIMKCDVNLDLPLVEAAAYLVLKEENENEEIDMSIVIERLAQLEMKSSNINKYSGSSSESSDSDSSEESDDSNEIPVKNNDLPEKSDDESDDGEEEESSDDDFSSEEEENDDDDDDEEEEEDECEEEEEWESCDDEEEEEEE